MYTEDELYHMIQNGKFETAAEIFCKKEFTGDYIDVFEWLVGASLLDNFFELFEEVAIAAIKNGRFDLIFSVYTKERTLPKLYGEKEAGLIPDKWLESIIEWYLHTPEYHKKEHIIRMFVSLKGDRDILYEKFACIFYKFLDPDVLEDSGRLRTFSSYYQDKGRFKEAIPILEHYLKAKNLGQRELHSRILDECYQKAGIKKTTKICSMCNYEIESNAKFCSECGNRV